MLPRSFCLCGNMHERLRYTETIRQPYIYTALEPNFILKGCSMKFIHIFVV